MTLSDNYKKLSYFLPNTFTALNMACGFASIIFSIEGRFYGACMLLILGALFDLVDGKLARLTGTESPFGEMFDSLSDLVTFGLAPALIFYMRFLKGSGRVGLVITFMFILCGALRLARFNSSIGKENPSFFTGLPIPGSALALAGYILLSIEVQWEFLFKITPFIYIFIFAALMISTIPFPSFKKSDWVKDNKRKVLISFFVLIALLFLYEEIMLIVIMLGYVLISIIYYLFNRKKFT